MISAFREETNSAVCWSVFHVLACVVRYLFVVLPPLSVSVFSNAVAEVAAVLVNGVVLVVNVVYI